MASIFICVAVAFMINKFSPVVIKVNSIIGPIEDKGPSLRGSNSLFTGLGDYSQVRNLENDINSLYSFSLVSTTIKDLNLEVGYYMIRLIFSDIRVRSIGDLPLRYILTNLIYNRSMQGSILNLLMTSLTD